MGKNSLNGLYLEYSNVKRVDQSNEDMFRELNECNDDWTRLEITNKLVTNNLALINRIISQKIIDLPGTCMKCRVSYDEFYSSGLLGLSKAIKNYRLGETKFISFAARCITNEIFMFIRSLKKHNNEVSLDKTFFEDNNGNIITILDTLIDENFNYMDDFIEEQYLISFLQSLKSKLSTREYTAIETYYLKEGSQRSLCKMFNLSQGQVSRVIKVAVEKAKKIYMEV